MSLNDSDDEFLGAALEAFGSASMEELGVDHDVCGLCDLQIEAAHYKSNHPKMTFEVLHKACFNGLRALERLMANNPKLAKQVLACRQKDQEKFKVIACSLVTKEKGKRSRDALNEVTEYVEKLTRTTTVKRKGAYVLLPEDQFIAWHMFNSRMSERAAMAKWEKDSQNVELAEVEDGILVVLVKKPTEVSRSDKLASSKEMGSNSARLDKQTAMKNMNNKADMHLAADRGISQLSSGVFGFGRRGLSPPGKAAYVTACLCLPVVFLRSMVWKKVGGTFQTLHLFMRLVA